jgi:hypothetical protein
MEKPNNATPNFDEIPVFASTKLLATALHQYFWKKQNKHIYYGRLLPPRRDLEAKKKKV